MDDSVGDDNNAIPPSGAHGPSPPLPFPSPPLPCLPPLPPSHCPRRHAHGAQQLRRWEEEEGKKPLCNFATLGGSPRSQSPPAPLSSPPPPPSTAQLRYDAKSLPIRKGFPGFLPLPLVILGALIALPALLRESNSSRNGKGKKPQRGGGGGAQQGMRMGTDTGLCQQRQTPQRDGPNGMSYAQGGGLGRFWSPMRPHSTQGPI